MIHQDGPDTYHVVEDVPTAQGARNMGLDPTTHRMFLVSVKSGAFTMMVVERQGH